MATNTGMFPNTIVTNAGKKMIVQSQNGSTLTITRVALGDGVLGNNEDQQELTAIKSEKLSADISQFEDLGNGQFTLTFTIDNSTIEKGFWHREIGIMAKVDDADEQLYAYTNAGSAASFLYDKSTPIQARTVKIDIVIGSAENVNVTIDKSVVYTTHKDLEEHNSDADAHAALVEKLNQGTAALLEQNNLYHVEATGYGIVSGCEPSISGLTVKVGAGVIHLADGKRKEIVQTNITLDNADPTNPRIDLVYINADGEVAKFTGTAAASPVVPVLPTGGISVCNVTIAAGATTGTINRVQTIAPNLANYVNVKDFGAVGDGTTDDTAAIQAAIQECSGKRLYIPAGDYLISDTLENHGDIDIICDKQARIFTNTEIEYLFKHIGNTTGSGFGGRSRVTIYSGIWDCNDKATNGLYFSTYFNCNITMLTVLGFSNIGIGTNSGGNGAGLCVNHCYIRGGTNGGYAGIQYLGNDDYIFFCEVVDCQIGYYLGTANHLIGCTAWIANPALYTKNTMAYRVQGPQCTLDACTADTMYYGVYAGTKNAKSIQINNFTVMHNNNVHALTSSDQPVIFGAISGDTSLLFKVRGANIYLDHEFYLSNQNTVTDGSSFEDVLIYPDSSKMVDYSIDKLQLESSKIKKIATYATPTWTESGNDGLFTNFFAKVKYGLVNDYKLSLKETNIFLATLSTGENGKFWAGIVNFKKESYTNVTAIAESGGITVSATNAQGTIMFTGVTGTATLTAVLIGR